MVALLGALPNYREEPLLVQLSASVQQLIDQAYHTIRDGQINNQVWQQLVCFVYHSTRPDQVIQLRHQLNTSQLAALDQMEEHGHGLVALAAERIKPYTPAVASQDVPPPTPPTPNPLRRRTVPWKRKKDPDMLVGTLPRLAPRQAPEPAQLDQAPLDLSITLLDHPLKGDLFKSTVVGFLAVLRVDPARQGFCDPYSYTSFLSGLVKIAQMLVALHAVREAKAGRASHPADALDKMHERFLLFRVRAPFG
ncbi:hypothetical protein BJX65DRAFT_308998 [Aspergillus insuetus]